MAESATPLALALIRGFRHAKQAAVLELVNRSDTRSDRAYAQAAAASVPLEELLHRAYADLAVTDFWRDRAELGESDQADCRQRYERRRARTADAIDALTGSTSLTRLGARFVEGMRIAISARGKPLSMG
jgi:uncharacterized protein